MKKFRRITPASGQQALPLPRRKRGGRANIQRIADQTEEIIWHAHAMIKHHGKISVGGLCQTWHITPGGASYQRLRNLLLSAGFTLAQLGLEERAPEAVQTKPIATEPTPEPVGADTVFVCYAGA